MLLRAVLLLVLAILIVRFLVRLGALAAAALREGAAPVNTPPPAVALVPCRRCGVFVPRAFASTAGDGFLCRSCAA
jgi:hypothetical protein